MYASKINFRKWAISHHKVSSKIFSKQWRTIPTASTSIIVSWFLLSTAIHSTSASRNASVRPHRWECGWFNARRNYKMSLSYPIHPSAFTAFEAQFSHVAHFTSYSVGIYFNKSINWTTLSSVLSLSCLKYTSFWPTTALRLRTKTFQCVIIIRLVISKAIFVLMGHVISSRWDRWNLLYFQQHLCVMLCSTARNVNDVSNYKRLE